MDLEGDFLLAFLVLLSYWIYRNIMYIRPHWLICNDSASYVQIHYDLDRNSDLTSEFAKATGRCSWWDSRSIDCLCTSTILIFLQKHTRRLALLNVWPPQRGFMLRTAHTTWKKMSDVYVDRRLCHRLLQYVDIDLACPIRPACLAAANTKYWQLPLTLS